MKTQAILGLLLFPLLVAAQKPPIKFGEVPIEDLKMNVYALDSSAEAVILADYGEATINYQQNQGFLLELNRIRRLKILKKSGYDWANFIIPIYTTDQLDEKLSGLKAVTYNLEGDKILESKLSKGEIFQEKATENWSNTRITFPNVKEGSVIDISYKIISPFLFNLQDWEFQSTIPVRWSEYIAKIPQYLQYEMYMQGYVPLDINEQTKEQKFITLQTKERTNNRYGATAANFETEKINYDEKKFRWVAKNVPAFKQEPYMANTVDYISRINFELSLISIPGRPIETVMGTWENINKEFLESTRFGGALKKSNSLSGTAKQLTSGKTSAEDKVYSIYSYVKSQIEWNGNYHKFADGDFKQVLEAGKGNSAEINLLLVGLLQNAGLIADPVVISTRDHGIIRHQFPLSNQFNYVICAVRVNDDIWLLDATDRTLPMSMLPARCLNGQGLLISKNDSKWIDLRANVKTRSLLESTIAFNDAGKLNCDIHITKEGYYAQTMRRQFIDKGEEGYMKAMKEHPDWQIVHSKFENVTNLNEPIHEVYSMARAEENIASDIMYIHPFIGAYMEENPFKLKERKYPVDFGSGFERVYMTTVKIPDNYIVDESPTNMAITLPNKGGRFIFNVNQVGNTLRVTSQLVVSRTLFTQEEYPFLREFYNQMVAKQEEMIVLKKSR